jgi:hypothetical protein
LASFYLFGKLKKLIPAVLALLLKVVTAIKKVKQSPLHAMEALGGRGGIALLIHDLGTRWG